MSEVTISQLASATGVSVERLLQQLGDAGVSKGGADDVITDQEKQALLDFLRQSHGKKAAPKPAKAGGRPLSLNKRKTTTLQQPSSGRPTGGRPSAARTAKTVSVEVRPSRKKIRPQPDEDQAAQERW